MADDRLEDPMAVQGEDEDESSSDEEQYESLQTPAELSDAIHAVVQMMDPASVDVQTMLDTVERVHRVTTYVLENVFAKVLSECIEMHRFHNEPRARYDVISDSTPPTHYWNESWFDEDAEYDSVERYGDYMSTRGGVSSLAEFFQSWNENREVLLWSAHERRAEDSPVTQTLRGNAPDAPMLVPIMQRVPEGEDAPRNYETATDLERRMASIEPRLQRRVDSYEITPPRAEIVRQYNRRRLLESARSGLSMSNLMRAELRDPSTVPLQQMLSQQAPEHSWGYVERRLGNKTPQTSGEYDTRRVAREWVPGMFGTIADLEQAAANSPAVRNAMPCPLLNIEMWVVYAHRRRMNAPPLPQWRNLVYWDTGPKLMAHYTLLLHETLTSMFTARVTLWQIFRTHIESDHHRLMSDDEHEHGQAIFSFGERFGADLADVINLLMRYVPAPIGLEALIETRERKAFKLYKVFRKQFGDDALDMLREHVVLFFDHDRRVDFRAETPNWLTTWIPELRTPLQELEEYVLARLEEIERAERSVDRARTSGAGRTRVRRFVHRLAWLATSDLSSNQRVATLRVYGEPPLSIIINERVLLLGETIRYETMQYPAFWSRLRAWKKTAMSRTSQAFDNTDMHLTNMVPTQMIPLFFMPSDARPEIVDMHAAVVDRSPKVFEWLGTPENIAESFAVLRLVLFSSSEIMPYNALVSAKDGHIPMDGAVLGGSIIRNNVTLKLISLLTRVTSCESDGELRGTNEFGVPVLRTCTQMRNFMLMFVSGLVVIGTNLFPQFQQLRLSHWCAPNFGGAIYDYWSRGSQANFVLKAKQLCLNILDRLANESE